MNRKNPKKNVVLSKTYINLPSGVINGQLLTVYARHAGRIILNYARTNGTIANITMRPTDSDVMNITLIWSGQYIPHPMWMVYTHAFADVDYDFVYINPYLLA